VVEIRILLIHFSYLETSRKDSKFLRRSALYSSACSYLTCFVIVVATVVVLDIGPAVVVTK
jgi:hypothetical protein